MREEHALKMTTSKVWNGVGTLVAHTFVKLASATQFTPITGATDAPHGVLQDTTALTDLPMSLVVFGATRALVGTGGITVDTPIAIDATGKVVAATPTYGTEQVVGWALETAAAGAVAEIFVCKVLA